MNVYPVCEPCGISNMKPGEWRKGILAATAFTRMRMVIVNSVQTRWDPIPHNKPVKRCIFCGELSPLHRECEMTAAVEIIEDDVELLHV